MSETRRQDAQDAQDANLTSLGSECMVDASNAIQIFANVNYLALTPTYYRTSILALLFHILTNIAKCILGLGGSCAF